MDIAGRGASVGSDPADARDPAKVSGVLKTPTKMELKSMQWYGGGCSMIRRWKLGATLLALGALAIGQANANVIVSFDPNPAVTTPGGVVNVNIVADMTDKILGWGLDLTLSNPGLASITNVTVGPLWSGSPGNDGDGLAGLHFPPPGVIGNGILLATVELTAGASTGTSDLILSVTPGDQSEGFALDPSGFDTFTLNTGVLNVVPEPGALALLLLGGVAAFRRR
ncbi:MAG: PEP-CTERM sorting domain-containing protein [Planctomycetota bacterium]|nr:MAG: PEP-CTERM sorting domain-containing protein [Planctomycetota bacterium]